jgi:hypothetical protein
MANCDIRVVAVVIPSPRGIAKGPCSLNAMVRLENIGPGQPTFNNSANQFEVCLASTAFAAEGGHVYRSRITVTEGMLKQDQFVGVHFSGVVFRQSGVVQVTATADCGGLAGLSITNNLRTQPSMQVAVVVVPVAWLWTEQVQFGLTDASGVQAAPVTTICPGQPYWVQATIKNLGLATAPASTATLTVSDSSGSVLATLDSPVPPINPSFQQVVTFQPSAPAPTPVGNTTLGLTAQVCADSKAVVPNQCDRAHLCSQGSASVEQAGQATPEVTFSLVAGQTIFPGMPVAIDWGIQNGCLDLGSVKATISFEGTPLYTSAPIHVGLQSSGGEQGVSVSPAGQRQQMLNDFWQINPPKGQQQTLQLQITGTGKNAGPYSALITFAIAPETITPGQWQWNPAPTSPDNQGGMDWNSSYDVSGVLTNTAKGGESMTANLLFAEFDDTNGLPGTPTGQTFTTSLSNIAANGTAAAQWSGLKQTWQWLVPAVWIIDGPTLKNLGYQVPSRFRMSLETRTRHRLPHSRR